MRSVMLCSYLAFVDVITRAGLQAPDYIEAGKLYRIPGDGKDLRNRAGWCKLFADGRGGVFGDWSTGLSEKWQTARDKPLSKAERQAFAKQCAEATAERRRIRKAEQQAAAIKAGKLYATAVEVNPAHPYLLAKGITAPAGLRQSGGLMLVPMCDSFTGKLRGLQTIAADSSKRFTTGMGLNGCTFTIARAADSASEGLIAICEGVATGASIYAATGWCVVCAFTANNLPTVAQVIRQQHPKSTIVICADNDHHTEQAAKGNAGLKAGRQAAKAVRGVLVAPPASGGTDWNDYAQAHGIGALREVLTTAITDTAVVKTERAVAHV